MHKHTQALEYQVQRGLAGASKQILLEDTQKHKHTHVHINTCTHKNIHPGFGVPGTAGPCRCLQTNTKHAQKYINMHTHTRTHTYTYTQALEYQVQQGLAGASKRALWLAPADPTHTQHGPEMHANCAVVKLLQQ